MDKVQAAAAATWAWLDAHHKVRDIALAFAIGFVLGRWV